MKLAGRSPYNASDEMHKVLARHSYSTTEDTHRLKPRLHIRKYRIKC